MPTGSGSISRLRRAARKSWLFRFLLHGHARKMGLGSVDTLSLAEARDEALECRKMVRAKIDPIETRMKQRQAAQLEAARSITFKAAALEYIGDHEETWKTRSTARMEHGAILWPSQAGDFLDGRGAAMFQSHDVLADCPLPTLSLGHAGRSWDSGGRRKDRHHRER